MRMRHTFQFLLALISQDDQRDRYLTLTTFSEKNDNFPVQTFSSQKFCLTSELMVHDYH